MFCSSTKFGNYNWFVVFNIPANGFNYVITQTDNVLNFSDEGDWDFSDATQGYDVNGSFGIAQEAPSSANYPLATHYKFESGSYFFLGFDETGYTYHGEQGGAINFTTAYDPPLSIFPFPFNNENSPYSDSVIDQPFSCTDCPPSLFRDDSSYSTIVSEGDVTLPKYISTGISYRDGKKWLLVACIYRL